MEGADPLDATSKVIPEAPVAELLDKNIKGLKIGVPKEYFIDGMDPEIESAVKNCAKEYEKAGAIIEEISMPHTKYALPVYYILMPAEASSNLARFDGIRYGKREDAESLLELYSKNRGLGFGPEPKRRIILGTYVLSAGYIDAYYNKALAVRELIKQDFKNAFAKVDLLLTPSSPSVAWKIGEKSEDPVAMYLSDIYTVSANLAGVPAISVPCGFTKNGLPMGLQFTARHFEEEKLYDAGAWLQAKTDFHLKVPQL
ncbi:MAG: aspartyl-tRNA(Asn)/glutamyl-tRNA (Gln) amidotransferase subunit A [uncultured bacterium]|nr:MAG: aspartyl-tRNA(Asn)/glutamyl-tRNA (Gln) amidotransferase subunit A [uncultured bacterium]